MRVLHLTPDPSSPSGIAAYGVRFREAVSAAGVSIEPLSVCPGPINSVAEVRRYVMAAEHVSVKGFDVVHAELGGGSLREFYALRHLQRQAALPTVATLHDAPGAVWWPFHTHFVRQFRIAGTALRVLGAPAATRLEESVVSSLDGVMTLSRSGAKAVGSVYGPKVAARTVSLPYPICAALGRTEPRAEHDCLTIGFLGYWYAGKGLMNLIAALADLQDRGVDFHAAFWGQVSAAAGSRPGSLYRAKVHEAISKNGLTERIALPGFLEPAEVAPSLRACDVVVLPYETGRPMAALRSTSAAMFDAFAAGTPVIASDVKALGDEITDGENGILLPAGDIGALTDALAGIASDGLLRERLRVGAAQKADSLDPAASARVALGVYADVLTRSRSVRDHTHLARARFS